MEAHFYATLRQIAGTKTVEFPLPKTVTVWRLVTAVIERFPAMREELLNENGNLHSHVHVFVNGRDSRFLEEGRETIISIEDKIDIFPAVGGG
ncbi:MAG: MoaD/ThiS family protein [Chloroflexi bacterium]|nr:MoaD/ThiS family protein [Chloroflexota bacterium]